MKISWGYKVAGLYIGFVIMIASMVFMSAASRTDLERKDYYEEELKHDQKMEAIRNMNSLGDTILIERISDQVKIIYPDFLNTHQAKIHLWVYNPSNETQDKKIFFTCNNSPQLLVTQSWAKGAYMFRFNIEVNDKKFFYEEQVIVQ